MNDDSHFVEGKKGFGDRPKHKVRGAPIKVTRAISGSCGKRTYFDLIDYAAEKGDLDWVDDDVYKINGREDDSSTGMGKDAIEFLRTMLQSVPVEMLPELLVSENEDLRQAAKRRIDEAREET